MSAGAHLVERLLTLVQEVRSPGAAPGFDGLGTEHAPPIEPPVIMMVGGTSDPAHAGVAAYVDVLVNAVRDWRGTVVSGGTSAGVSGLAAELGVAHHDRIRTIGFLPAGATADPRYDECRRTSGSDFSPLEPLQAWTDILASGLRPDDVLLIGIGGGPIAAIEYRIALALGAAVVIVAGSGRAADALLADPYWSAAPNLTRVEPREEDIAALVGGHAAATRARREGGQAPRVAGPRGTLASRRQHDPLTDPVELQEPWP